MEFCIQAWCPYMAKDIKVLEKIQRRATKMVPELKRLPYEDRLKRLGVYALTARRLSGYLIETYKLLHEHTNIDYHGSYTNHNQRRGYNAELICSVREL